MAGWECSSVVELEPGIDSESATKPKPVADPKSISNLDLGYEPTYEPPIEPKSTTDSESPNEPESRANGSDDLSGS